MAELNRYRSTINPRKLSASAINTYINCPLSFYLTYIAGFKREDEFHDYMDESTFGTIIHGVLEDIYKTASKRYSHFNADVIHKIKAETITLQQTITRRINQHYIKLGENCLTPLKGDAEIFGRIMLQYINLTLDRDIEAGDFSYIAGEYGVKNDDELFQLVIKGSSDEAIINFVYSIDRVDEHFNDDGTSSIRIIDYKTGEDPTQIVDLIDMFQSRNSSTPRAKAMLQLFMYAQAYAQQTAVTASSTEQKPIQPWIYSIRKVATEPFTPLKISDSGSVGTDGSKKRYKVDITDYSLYVEEFNDLLLEKLKELFDPQTPFTPAEDDHACTFCKFTEICRKPTPSSF
jgi:CRISPR/Cas system-associated exonuclease Cas4 (RecB family)